MLKGTHFHPHKFPPYPRVGSMISLTEAKEETLLTDRVGLDIGLASE